MNKNNTNAVPLNTTTFNTRLLNTTKLNTNGFPVLSKRSGSSADISQAIMDSLVCWYDPGKQQCTNESMAANPVLADLSGNGHDIECFNFGWSGMSGIGGYVFQPLDRWYKSPSNNGTYTVEGYTLRITKLNTCSNVYYICNTGGKNYVESIESKTVTTKSFRIRINGLPDGKKVYIGGLLPLAAGSEHINILFSKQYFNSNGEHIVASVQATVESENDVWSGNVNYPDISIESDTADDVDITIEILPEYPNALVSDGVDDYCYTDGLPILTDYTVIAKRKILADKVSALASKATDNNSTDGAFIFDAKNGGGYIACNFGANNALVELYPEDVSYQTKESYNGSPIIKLNHTDTDKLSLFTFSAQNNLVSQYALYSFLLFDRTLTTAEIEWVKKNMIESGGVLKTNWSDSSLWKNYLDGSRGIGVVKSTKVIINTNIIGVSALFESIGERTIDSITIKVTGLQNDIIMYYKYYNGSTEQLLVTMIEDGVYTLPQVSGKYIGFMFNKTFENENIVIQQLLS